MISGLPHTTTASSRRYSGDEIENFLKEREPIATTETAAIIGEKRPSNGHERSSLSRLFSPDSSNA